MAKPPGIPDGEIEACGWRPEPSKVLLASASRPASAQAAIMYRSENRMCWVDAISSRAPFSRIVELPQEQERMPLPAERT